MKGSDLCGLLLFLLLTGCGSTVENNTQIGVRPFQVDDIAKSDVDMVVEIELRQSMIYLRQLMGKLYRRNPKEWRKSKVESLEQAVARVFDEPRTQSFPELQGKRGADCIMLAFDETYPGDRVLAFMEGLRSMLLAAHNDKHEFYLMDELDPQKLYNAARNIEIAIWKLSNARDQDGALYLISNQTDGSLKNLSYERLFGKLIALQDTIAVVVAQSTSRRIKTIIQSLASAVFMPI